ncbi:hypothetical protein [Mucilaginibacter gotjawali]|uniref:Uncharacterized protein n=1 Tax=Mucilaginibacter gotjawali TaxID=1550579 RepID=A0A839SJY5_9SPHI|nr:hypothetical protein [Mucilaginibacter gotjawali]MBB3056839.1 hypothetical protein [Mucilaginibacter gotjawali]
MEDTEKRTFFNGKDCPYVGIELNQFGELVLFNWCDTGMVVNSQSGIIERKWNSK